MDKVFYKLFDNILSLYKKRNLFLQLLGIYLTFVSVVSGFDWWYFKETRGHILQSFLFPAVIIGTLVPVAITLIFFFIGKFNKNKSIINTSYALAQAGILASTISAIYKVFTGRVPPPHDFNNLTNSIIYISHQFRFGIFRGGAFNGWPSSHTTVAFAMSVTLFSLYPKNKFIKYLAIIYALYIGIGVSTNIHWFSEFIMGAILGTIIGLIVGKSFYNKIL